jgi:hypothetical protein
MNFYFIVGVGILDEGYFAKKTKQRQEESY